MTAGAGIIASLEYEIHAAMDDHGIDAEIIRSVTVTVVGHLLSQYGGHRHYIAAADTTERDTKILKAWRHGESRSNIAKNQGVSKSTVCRVIAKQSPRRNKSRSTGFGSDDWVL